MADVPSKTAAKIVRIADEARELFDVTDPAQTASVVFWVVTQIVTSRRFSPDIENRTAVQICQSIFENSIDVVQDVAALAKEFRYQLRFGRRLSVSRDPRGCTII